MFFGGSERKGIWRSHTYYLLLSVNGPKKKKKGSADLSQNLLLQFLCLFSKVLLSVDSELCLYVKLLNSNFLICVFGLLFSPILFLWHSDSICFLSGIPQNFPGAGGVLSVCDNFCQFVSFRTFKDVCAWPPSWSNLYHSISSFNNLGEKLQ